MVLAVFVTLSIFDLGGVAGQYFYGTVGGIFGLGYYLLPIMLGVIGVSLMSKGRTEVARLHAIFGAISLLAILGIADIATNGSGPSVNIAWGGYLGSSVSWLFVRFFGTYASILLLGALLIVSLIVMFDERPNLIGLWQKIKDLFTKEITVPKLRGEDEYDGEVNEISLPLSEGEWPQAEGVIKADTPPPEEREEEPEEELPILKSKKFVSKAYVPPPLSLLEKDKGKPNV